MGLLTDLLSAIDARKRVLASNLRDPVGAMGLLGGSLADERRRSKRETEEAARRVKGGGGLLGMSVMGGDKVTDMPEWEAAGLAPMGLLGITKALHGSAADFDKFAIQPDRNPALFFSVPEKGNDAAIAAGWRPRKTQAEYIAEGPFGGLLYEAEIADGKVFDPLNDAKAKSIYKRLFPDRDVRQWVEYPDIYVGSPLVKALTESGYNRVRVYEPAVQGFSEAVFDPSLVTILGKKKTK